ncbi:MAG: CBS domain-containing protein [Planctomycetales bacterium]|nr:CBS domain-containing protein [Planctomycetales bacterium]
MTAELEVLKSADFGSDQDVRWCPGCGDYSILAQMKKMLPSLGVPRENLVFISGIGCSSRFPYYMNTYGVHSIHGRAPALATGLKAVRPELTVFVITGDGDGLSIGGNHLMHVIRRNLDINIVLFNNRIYGLTKGQYSPTSPLGKVTKSTPMGSIDNPLHPLSIAIGCEASFVARSIDVNIKHLGDTLLRAAQHRGTAFIEVYQNCNVFNDGAWEYATDRAVKADNILELEHGKPLIFGKNRDKGIRLNGMEPEVVELGKGVSEDDLLFHDEKAQEPSLAYLLSRLRYEDGFPEPIGVFRAVDAPRYDAELNRQVDEAIAKKGRGDLKKLLNSGETWTVTEDKIKPPKNLGDDGDHGTVIEEASGRVVAIDDLSPELSAMEKHLSKDLVSVLPQRRHVVVTPDVSVGDVLKQLVEQSVGCAVVVENGKKVVGIFSERDALVKLNTQFQELRSRPVAEFMTKDPSTLKSDAKIAFAVRKMDLGGYRHVPIVDEEGSLQAVISVRDILSYLTDCLQAKA